MRYQADELRYEQVTVLEKEAIFTELRVLRDSVPKGFSCYEVRHDDESQGNPVEIARGILVNFYGTLLVQGSLEQVEKEGYCFLEEDDWYYSGESSFTLQEYRKDRGIGEWEKQE